jgi:hypothetical protein
MSISGITDSATALGTSPSQTNVQKTLEQRAQDGDQVAKAELKAEDPQPASTPPASEPGKGENVDQYV